MVNFEDVEQAYHRIKQYVNHTPVMTSRTLNEIVEANVYLKCENFQRVGAFKPRGALNKILQLSNEEKSRGIVTHSSGNHAQAVALAGKLLGIKTVVVMPENAPQVKVDATKGYGAEVVRCDNNTESRVRTAEQLGEKHGYTLVHAYDDYNIIAGAGTAAYELIKEVGKLDYIFFPIGGGGLASGTIIASKGMIPDIEIIGVEPEKADDAFRSLRDNVIYPSPYPNTIADGLRTQLSEKTFGIIKKYNTKIITVTENEIVDAMKFLWERMKIVVEPSGAVPLAGILKLEENLRKKQVGGIISGGNVELNDFFKIFYDKISLT
ncbi:MAG: threonine/serine dehydratase [Candidatus Lokiarchaeota archaeon]|nr:threonine/serine dehydratase [Candidatus Lokiarchaeota archaeon]